MFEADENETRHTNPFRPQVRAFRSPPQSPLPAPRRDRCKSCDSFRTTGTHLYQEMIHPRNPNRNMRRALQQENIYAHVGELSPQTQPAHQNDLQEDEFYGLC